MDWKKEAVEDLKNYAKRKVAVQSLRERMEMLQAECEAPGQVRMDRLPQKNGAGGAEARMIRLIAEKERLGENLRATQRMVEMVERGLGALGSEERRVLEGFYRQEGGYKAERLAEEMHMDRATVYRMRDEALRNFTLAMYGVLEQ